MCTGLRFQLTSDKSYNKVLHSHQIINKFSTHQLNTYNFGDEVRKCLGHRVRASGGSRTSDKGNPGHPDLEKGGGGWGLSLVVKQGGGWGGGGGGGLRWIRH